MAKKGGKHQSKTPAEKKATTEKNKQNNILKQSLVAENNKPINEYIKSNVKSTNTINLINNLMDKFNISKCKSLSRIRSIRKSMGLYCKNK